MSDLVPVEEVIKKLSQMGLSGDFIAQCLEVSRTKVTRTVTKSRAPADEELAEAMRSLAWTAYRESARIFEFGTPDQKLSLIRPLISNASKTIGAGEGSKLEDARESFQQLLIGMRDDAEPETPTLTTGTYNPNQTLDDGEVPD